MRTSENRSTEICRSQGPGVHTKLEFLKIEIAQQVTYIYQDFVCERDSFHAGKMICRDFF